MSVMVNELNLRRAAFECHVSSGTGTQFNINAQFETLFSCLEEKDVFFKGLRFSRLSVNEGKTLLLCEELRLFQSGNLKTELVLSYECTIL
jgi:hypothetical protein